MNVVLLRVTDHVYPRIPIQAAKSEAQCVWDGYGGGGLQFLRQPSFYEFAGQVLPSARENANYAEHESASNVRDFDWEPWDGTCEAEGAGTLDDGTDYAVWFLDAGEYELNILAREDGTALDAIYVAGPNSPPPDPARRYARGESSRCTASSSKSNNSSSSTTTSKSGNTPVGLIIFLVLLIASGVIGGIVFMLRRRARKSKLQKQLPMMNEVSMRDFLPDEQESLE